MHFIGITFIKCNGVSGDVQAGMVRLLSDRAFIDRLRIERSVQRQVNIDQVHRMTDRAWEQSERFETGRNALFQLSQR